MSKREINNESFSTLTKREYMAAIVASGLLSDKQILDCTTKKADNVARVSLSITDAILRINKEDVEVNS